MIYLCSKGTCNNSYYNKEEVRYCDKDNKPCDLHNNEYYTVSGKTCRHYKDVFCDKCNRYLTCDET